METIEFIFKILGGIATLGAFVFAIGKFLGKHQAKEEVDAGKLVELSCELAIYKTKLEEMQDNIHELEKAGLVSTQKIQTLESQQKVMFDMIDKLGLKLEDQFNKLYELKG